MAIIFMPIEVGILNALYDKSLVFSNHHLTFFYVLDVYNNKIKGELRKERWPQTKS